MRKPAPHRRKAPATRYAIAVALTRRAASAASPEISAPISEASIRCGASGFSSAAGDKSEQEADAGRDRQRGDRLLADRICQLPLDVVGVGLEAFIGRFPLGAQLLQPFAGRMPCRAIRVLAHQLQLLG